MAFRHFAELTDKKGKMKMAYQKYRAKLLKEYNYCCAWCGETQNLHIDHVKTQFSGGGDDYENLQMLCSSCNCTKNKWVLPKLKPREPATDRAKMLRRKMVFRKLIMPFRRTYDPKFYTPKKELLK
jgi:5-methylcytosine-specific restriction endonuclease McrA